VKALPKPQKNSMLSFPQQKPYFQAIERKIMFFREKNRLLPLKKCQQMKRKMNK